MHLERAANSHFPSFAINAALYPNGNNGLDPVI